jgi:hypothetical protein
MLQIIATAHAFLLTYFLLTFSPQNLRLSPFHLLELHLLPGQQLHFLEKLC